jgi:protein arginine kinase activator
MKCTNCGKNEVNFYYESNINGKVTRQQLCSECAQKLGFGDNSFFSQAEGMFNNMLSGFSDFFGTRRRSFPSFGSFAMPTLLMPGLVMPDMETDNGCTNDSCQSCGCQTQQQSTQSDTEMNKRRQINMLRSQMQDAVASENFEQAAKLRDQIHDLEGKTD